MALSPTCYGTFLISSFVFLLSMYIRYSLPMQDDGRVVGGGGGGGAGAENDDSENAWVSSNILWRSERTCTHDDYLHYNWFYSLKELAQFCSEHLVDFSTYPLVPTTQIYCLTGAIISETHLIIIINNNNKTRSSTIFHFRAGLFYLAV